MVLIKYLMDGGLRYGHGSALVNQRRSDGGSGGCLIFNHPRINSGETRDTCGWHCGGIGSGDTHSHNNQIHNRKCML